MSHFITPPSPHWPGPHPTGFHTSRSTMSNPLFCFNPPFGFFSTATTSFPLLLSSYISFMSCLYLHVCPCTLKKRSVMPLNNGWTADMTVYELKWGASSRSLHLVRFGRGGDLVWCSVWRLWLCVCVYVSDIYLSGTGAECFTSDLYYSLYDLTLNYAVNMLEWLNIVIQRPSSILLTLWLCLH